MRAPFILKTLKASAFGATTVSSVPLHETVSTSTPVDA